MLTSKLKDFSLKAIIICDQLPIEKLKQRKAKNTVWKLSHKAFQMLHR